MREIHNLVEHGEAATRGSLGGDSHARGEYLYFVYFCIYICILVFLYICILVCEYLYFIFNFVFLYILVTDSSIPIRPVEREVEGEQERKTTSTTTWTARGNQGEHRQDKKHIKQPPPNPVDHLRMRQLNAGQS